MKITNGTITLEIEDANAATSSYLAAALSLMDTDIILDVTDSGSLALDVPTDILKNFIDFISGDNVSRMEERDEEFFSFMGFPNTSGYPLSYWQVKVRDDWIRDNPNLWRDELYYGLTSIEFDDENLVIIDILDIPEESYISGEAALYIAGGTINMAYDTTSHTSYTEEAFSHDVDCLGLVYAEGQLWATGSAIYAIDNKMNWFDIKRYTTSYVTRLISMKEYHVMLPSFELSKVNRNMIQDHLDLLIKQYLSYNIPYTTSILSYSSKLYRQMNLGPKKMTREFIYDTTGELGITPEGLGYLNYYFDRLTKENVLSLLGMPEVITDGVRRSPRGRYMYTYGIDEAIDMTDIVIEGFSLFSSISLLPNTPDRFPFIRDEIASWFKSGDREGAMISKIHQQTLIMSKKTSIYSITDDIGLPPTNFNLDDPSRLILAFAYNIRLVEGSYISNVVDIDEFYNSSKYYNNRRYKRRLLPLVIKEE